MSIDDVILSFLRSLSGIRSPGLVHDALCQLYMRGALQLEVLSLKLSKNVVAVREFHLLSYMQQ